MLQHPAMSHQPLGSQPHSPLVEISTLLWIQRNEFVHGKDASSKGNILDAALNNQIKHMFLTAQRSVHPEDAHLFLTPLEDRSYQTDSKPKTSLA